MGLRILILSRTPIGKQMSSPGIRYVNMRRVLQEALPDATVTIATPRAYRQEGSDEYGVLYYEPLTAVFLVRRYDVVIAMSFPMSVALASPFLRKPLLVLDFFSQFHFEWMEVGRDLFWGTHRRLWTRAGQLYANLQLMMADFVTCANERQREAYLGVMASLGLLTPRTYDRDPTLRGLIDVVPHGLRKEPFPDGAGGIKGSYPGIEKGDKLILWLGGVLYWYDPISLLRALKRVRETHPEVKLLFLGTKYPGEGLLGEGLRLRQAVDETRRLGMWDDGVCFHFDWVPYEEVIKFLQDADFSATTYFTNAETLFAHRTRFNDYIWARLPLLCTRGDILAEEIDRRGWGIAVPENDEEAIYKALMRLVEDEAFVKTARENLRRAATEMSWEAAFEPLLQFLRRSGGPAPIAEPRRPRALSILRSALAYLGMRQVERTYASIRDFVGLRRGHADERLLSHKVGTEAPASVDAG
jgi:glycosyltransferase involved in cell wall biosynthesis